MKKRDPKASKEKIVANAKILFAQKGFSASSMDELALMCNLNKAMIFYYFKNKQNLYESVAQEILKEIYSKIKKENANYQKPIDKLDNFIKTYASFACAHPYFPALLLKELSTSGAVISENLFLHMRELFALFSNILKNGEEKGCFYDTNPMILYFMVIGTLNLMVTTKPLRVKANELSGIDTCLKCNIDEISHYVIKKMNKMLKDEK